MDERRPRVVVITGASAGVGRATVRAFAEQGASIGLLARGRAGLEGARRDAEDRGARALAIPTDVADFGQVERAAKQIEEELGPIDVWVNNAMTSVFSPVKEMKPEEYRRVTEVTYLGYVYGTLAALSRMRTRNRGVIIQVSSALAFRSIPLQSAYCASKHAIKGFTESLLSELIHDESAIQVCMAHMPALNTPQFHWVKSRLAHKAQPVPPIFQPEVAAEAITYLADHPQRDLYVGFSTLKAVLGEKVAPAYIDRRLATEGYEGQQYDGPEDPNRPSNLWQAVDEERDFGAHGGFDQRAQERSWELEAATHPRTLALVGAGALGILTLIGTRLLMRR